ncbi:hypothetical protein PHLCEN_2v10422 [Hermanssonia centrifuga]|uniref:MFS general substrate transporter n=1 Tax=Hermanssonia centrifuga TaxID=98765 RepID=A0A2R6NMX5_9APHY|nr:hypothetical protein PHLCEN_2v10422 [Hermanssonia centrifuga]
MSTRSDSLEECKDQDIPEKITVDSEVDLTAYYERNAGRLVVDPDEARVEFGEQVACRLKLTKDGTRVLWPQPSDDPEDPQNWSDFRKGIQLLIITLAAIVPDFDSGIGTASIFALARQFNTTSGVINNLTNKEVLTKPFRLGWHPRCRSDETIWTASGVVLDTAMRCLTGFFGTAPQVTGLYVVSDIYPFHLQARKLNIWTMGFIISPFLSPFAFGFMVARANWRWTYGIGSIYGLIVLLLIAFLGEETMYDRSLPDPKPIPMPASRLRQRFETLIGVTGARMAKYRSGWKEVNSIWFKLIWRPHLFGILLFEAMLFGFSVGLNGTNIVFLEEQPPNGYGFTQFAIAGCYGTPVVAVLIGELLGRYLNDWIMNVCIRRNNGVFESESRLWACYVAVVLYIIGFILIGAAFQDHLNISCFIIGWGLVEIATMVNTVAVYAYVNDSFPRLQGEISALLDLGRTLGGFSVAYFQVPWATKNGAIQTFGVEAAIVAGLFLLVVPTLQIKGSYLRVECKSVTKWGENRAK